MNLKLTSLVAAVAFFMNIGMVHAGEAVRLSESQMDRITAGWGFAFDLEARVRPYIHNLARVDQNVHVATTCAFAACNTIGISTGVANNTTVINNATVTVINNATVTVNAGFRI